MSYRAIVAGIALFALLSSGCQQCQVGRASRAATDLDSIPDSIRHGSQELPADEPATPGNALNSIADNKFTWSMAHRRVDVPLSPKPADATPDVSSAGK